MRVFQAGEYEDGIAMNSGWAEGDWNGDGDFNTTDFVVAFADGEFDTGDLVFAFQDGGYATGRRAVHAVPEPSASVWMLIMLLSWVFACRRRSREG